MELKECKNCKENKPKSEYYKNKLSKDRLQYVCKSCWLNKCKKFRADNPDTIKNTNRNQYLKKREERIEKANAYQKAHPEQRKRNRANFIKRNPRRMRELDIKRKYGISLEFYDSMILKQNNKCLICKTSLESIKKCIDHDHLTLRIRGILCSRCNTSLGLLKENITTLKNMIKYIVNNHPKQLEIKQ